MLSQNSDVRKGRFIACLRKFLKFPFLGAWTVCWAMKRDKVDFDRHPRKKIVENNNKKIPAPETGAGGVLGSDD